MADPKEKFYHHFQAEVTLIESEIGNLATTAPGSNERQAGVEKVLAGISGLSKEVMDATDFTPSYDQRTYSQAVKALTEKLNETTGKLGPKSRFQFKPRNKAAAQSQGVPDPRVHRPFGNGGGQDSEGLNPLRDDSEVRDAAPSLESGKDYNEELSRPDARGIRRPSFSAAKNIAISGHTGLHVVLPSTAARATSSGSLTNLKRCVVDMTAPTSAAPFAGLALKNITHSLVIAGYVAGPAHVTGIEDSIIVVAARQVRMHDCKNVRVYLHCSSHPIIEDCSGVAFAPLPPFYSNESTKAETNQWKEVDDFKWLKDVASPNWGILAEEDRVSEDLWANMAAKSGEDILREFRIVTETGRAFGLVGEATSERNRMR
ncbi:tubulin binding cofactor C-domain-containing protein [Xylaria intraflava]|nr:tubulin binding cofactor C-domain-containing protein [Xylaria intraflava]